MPSPAGGYPSHGGRYLLQEGEAHASVEPSKSIQTLGSGAAVSSLKEIIADQIEREDIESSREERITAIQHAISRSLDEALLTQQENVFEVRLL